MQKQNALTFSYVKIIILFPLYKDSKMQWFKEQILSAYCSYCS